MKKPELDSGILMNRINRITEMETAFDRVGEAVKTGLPLSPATQADVEKLENTTLLTGWQISRPTNAASCQEISSVASCPRMRYMISSVRLTENKKAPVLRFQDSRLDNSTLENHKTRHRGYLFFNQFDHIRSHGNHRIAIPTGQAIPKIWRIPKFQNIIFRADFLKIKKAGIRCEPTLQLFD